VRYSDLSEKDKKRFWSKVRRGNKDECWLWKGAVNEKGHGRINVSRREKGAEKPVSKLERAHRVAWMIAHKKSIPTGKCVLHTCPNLHCMNPAHLTLGSKSQATKDMLRRTKGLPRCFHCRYRRFNEETGEYVFTKTDRVMVKFLYKTGAYQPWELADHYKVPLAKMKRILEDVETRTARTRKRKTRQQGIWDEIDREIDEL